MPFAAVAVRFDVITLFPELFGPHLSHGVTRRAFEPGGGVEVCIWPLRDYATGPYRRVDDRPFGGGPGMVMMPGPLAAALAAVRAQRPGPGPLIHFTPAGRPLDQSVVVDLASGPGAILLCGRYEGVDQRFVDRHVDFELSLGDFVLSGGELPALVLLDAIARLQPGVLTESSHRQDSFGDGLLEGPQYTRPETWIDGDADWSVPAVLRGGHHADQQRWRRQQSLALTARRRPDLIESARRDGRLSPDDESFLRSINL